MAAVATVLLQSFALSIESPLRLQSLRIHLQSHNRRPERNREDGWRTGEVVG